MDNDLFSSSDSENEQISDDSTSDKDDFKVEKSATDCATVTNPKGVASSPYEEVDNCPICFEPWTSSGSHKLCCLKCGHLFGHSCILRWIKSQGSKGRCPECNIKATRKDIRFLYAKNLRVIDTSEHDRMKAAIEVERDARLEAERGLFFYRAKYQCLETEYAQLCERVNLPSASKSNLPPFELAAQELSHDVEPSTQNCGRYELIKSIELSITGNCRVTAACDYLNTLCVSQQSTNPIFKGFGIRKIISTDSRPVKYIHLHTQPIRDMVFNPGTQNGLLLSASLDKRVRLTSLLNDQVVQSYHCPSSVWSCCWSAPESPQLFAGCANGLVMVFDIRVTSGPLGTVQVPGQMSPVTALHYRPGSPSVPSIRGLLVGLLTQVTFMAETVDATEYRPARPAIGGEGDRAPEPVVTGSQQQQEPASTTSLTNYSSHPIPVENSCLVSLSLVPTTGHFLASYRPTQRRPNVHHQLAELCWPCLSASQSSAPPDTHGRITCRHVNTLIGGTRMKLMTRSKVFVAPRTDLGLFAVVSGEEAGGAAVWKCGEQQQNCQKLQTLQPPDCSAESPVVDVCPFQPEPHSSGPTRLALLTEHSLHLYRWCA